MKGLESEIQEIEAQSEELGHKEKQWLEARGWKQSCNTPGCRWLFQKDLKDGRVLLMPQKSAIIAEREMGPITAESLK